MTSSSPGTPHCAPPPHQAIPRRAEMSPLLKIADEVRDAIADGRPVVALESTIIAHGLPRPRNLQAAHDFEAILTDAGVVPATIAVIDGVPTVGLDADDDRDGRGHH